MILIKLLLVSFYIYATIASVKDNIIFVILSQSNTYHLKLAEELRSDILQQTKTFSKPPNVYLSHQDFPHAGEWTVIPIIPQIVKKHPDGFSWVVFLEDRTKLNVTLLMKVLEKRNPTENQFVGYSLQDEESTIIHHFAFHDKPKSFKYPNFASVFLMSSALLQNLKERMNNKVELTTDFSIDAAFELALFVWDKGNGTTLEHESQFCIKEGDHCATYPSHFSSCEATTSTTNKAMYFAVKTCEKFHEDRLNVVKNTWGQHASRIYYFSDVEDKSIPTISTGVTNTEHGHCAKTMKILNLVAKDVLNEDDVNWIILADDDTIIGISQLQKVLSCYDNSEAVVIGERYGYNLYSNTGLNYLTGGAGIVFSKTLLQLLVQPGICECPTLDTPDDMFLGHCLTTLGVSVTHSPYFHQARPADYAVDFLKSQKPVSFHKHWMMDPVQTYKTWFGEDDNSIINHSSIEHKEL